jgi:hypothetical protein
MTRPAVRLGSTTFLAACGQVAQFLVGLVVAVDADLIEHGVDQSKPSA